MLRLDTKTARAKLEVREAPHYIKLAAGRFLGLRKRSEDSQKWTARMRDDSGEQVHALLGELSENFDFDQAVAAARAWFKKHDAGVTGETNDGKPATVEGACREYVADRKRQKGYKTAATAHRIFARRVYGDLKKAPATGWAIERDPIAAIRLDKIRGRNLEEWRERLLAAKLGRSTINREMTSIRAALNLAVKNRLVSADQAREWQIVTRYKTDDNRRNVYLDLAQRQRLLETACTTFTYTVVVNSKVRKYTPRTFESRGAIANLIEASMHTGARPGELVTALRSAFDSRTQSLTLTGKTGKRTVPISPDGVAFFDRMTKSKLPKAPLLTRDDGKAWGASDWHEVMRAVASLAKMPPGTVLYTLRHSWITEAVLSGMSVLEVARMTGTSLEMIDEHYGHLAESTARARLATIKMV